jgi:hypothetical protein
MDRNSSCAATHSGTYRSTSGLPSRTRSSAGAHVQALDESGRARLHYGLIALVESDRADGFDPLRHAAAPDFGRAHSEVLLHTRADRDLALVAVAVRIHRHQHHVHERRLAWLVEAFAWHHRVVPVEDLLARRGIISLAFNASPEAFVEIGAGASHLHALIHSQRICTCGAGNAHDQRNDRNSRVHR